MKKLNQTGIAHWILPVFVIAVVAVIGAYVMKGSHADAPVAGNAVAAPAAQSSDKNVQFLNYASAAQSPGVTPVGDTVPSIGTQQVSQVSGGAQLDYLTGGKVSYSSICYYARAVNPKGVGTTAKVEFVGQGNSKTLTLTVGNGYKYICVKSGSKPLKAYNVYNEAPANGPSVLIYQVVLTT